MNTRDEQLSVLLKRWPDIEPPPDFDVNVRRRIRLAQTEQPARASRFVVWLQRWTWQPVSALVMAVLIGMMAGTWGGVTSAPKSVDREIVPFQFLNKTTLSAAYLRMTGVEQR